MKVILINIIKTISVLMISITFNSQALPKYNVEHDTNAHGIARIKLTNATNTTLACYIAIDGFKKKFILGPFNSSKWYAATDKRFDTTSFRTWCDFLEFYPHYEKYRR